MIFHIILFNKILKMYSPGITWRRSRWIVEIRKIVDFCAQKILIALGRSLTDLSIYSQGTLLPHLTFSIEVSTAALQMASQCRVLFVFIIYCFSYCRSGGEKFSSTNPEAYMTSVPLYYESDVVFIRTRGFQLGHLTLQSRSFTIQYNIQIRNEHHRRDCIILNWYSILK